MLSLLRMLTLRRRRGGAPNRQVRNELKTLKRWSERSPEDRYQRDS